MAESAIKKSRVSVRQRFSSNDEAPAFAKNKEYLFNQIIDEKDTQRAFRPSHHKQSNTASHFLSEKALNNRIKVNTWDWVRNEYNFSVKIENRIIHFPMNFDGKINREAVNLLFTTYNGVFKKEDILCKIKSTKAFPAGYFIGKSFKTEYAHLPITKQMYLRIFLIDEKNNEIPFVAFLVADSKNSHTNYFLGYGSAFKKQKSTMNSLFIQLNKVLALKESEYIGAFVVFEFLHVTAQFENRIINEFTRLNSDKYSFLSALNEDLKPTIYNFEHAFVPVQDPEEKAEEQSNYYNPKTVTFDDVYYMDDVIQNFKDIGKLLINYQEFEKSGINVPYGVLLCGAPGCGKTLVTHAFINEFNFPVYTLDDCRDEGVIDYEQLFRMARNNRPSVILLDELDKIEIDSSLFSEMNGQIKNNGVLVLACTNSISGLHPAILRPGRFDRKIFFPSLDNKTLEKMLRKRLSVTQTPFDFGTSDIAPLMGDVNGAYITTYVNEAKIKMVLNDIMILDTVTMLKVIEEVNRGIQRKTPASKEERKITAVHEAGHALVGMLLLGARNVVKVDASCESGQSGYVQFNQNIRRLNSKEDYLNQIKISLAGNLAEQIFLHKATSGAVSDLSKASVYAEAMISQYGFNKLSDVLDGVYNSEASDDSKNAIITQAKAIIDEMEIETRQIFNNNKELFFEILDKLLNKGVLFNDDILEIGQEMKKARATTANIPTILHTDN